MSKTLPKINTSSLDDLFTTEEQRQEAKLEKVVKIPIEDIADFKKNLEENCIPFETVEMDECNYEEFLQKRRELISSRLKQYYFSL